MRRPTDTQSLANELGDLLRGHLPSTDPMERFSVPVIIDEFRTYGEVVDPDDGTVEDFWLARCIFLMLNSTAPTPIWTVFAEGTDGWLLGEVEALGLAGVVIGRRPRSEFAEPSGPWPFDDPRDIAALFDLEAEYPLLVEMADVWLPVDALRAEREEAQRGDAFRISLRLFQSAYLHRTGALTTSELIAVDWTGYVEYSPEESAAFARWTQSEIDLAVEQFPKSDNLMLGWTADRELDEGASDDE